VSLRPRSSTFSVTAWLGAVICVLALLIASPAVAQEEAAAKIAKLNKQALDAFDNLNFDQAKGLLEQALSDCDLAGLTNDPVVARTHLNLGMLLIAGFQQRDRAIDQFKAAMKIQPNITAPAGLFNPEVQTAFDEVKANLKTEIEPPKVTPKPVTSQTAPAPKSAHDGTEESEQGQGEEEETASKESGSRIFLSLGVGSGFGVAKGHLDANKDIYQGGNLDNSWSGGLAWSRLGHLSLGVGYFISSDLMLSLEGRIQFVSGTTATGMTEHCVPSCSSPGTAIAAIAKASWFFAPAPLRPFLSGGLGGGSIRQVVKLGGVADCGNGSQQCVDTVTGGPVLLAVGGGIAYEMGSLALLAVLTANVGVPNFMLNLDAILGLGLRL
jgi:hypothetical protein